MPKFAWLLVGFGALMLLSKGAAGFLIGPLLLGALLFALFARGPRRGFGWHGYHGGQRHYHWRGQSGTYGRNCRPRAMGSPEHHDAERVERDEPPRANTGETTKL